MNQDFKQYQHIIEQLKPMAREPEFNQVLHQVASELPKEKRFLIKMEVKRLARPCMRSIDLRGQVDGKCRLYEYGGISHYLDDVAIDAFEQQVRIFGHYSFGVYESVLTTENNYRVIREKAEKHQQEIHQQDKPKSPISQFDVPNVSLLQYSQRKQERMNFAVALEIFTETNMSVRATSVDISTTGIKVKLSKDQVFKPGDKISVHFRGLEEEYALDKKVGVSYQIVSISRQKEFQFLQLKRTNDVNNHSFDQFLEKFIHGNKRRYKVNMDNTIDAIMNKSCEQYFSATCPTLPVFIDIIDDKPLPRFAMANEVNRNILSYWHDENDELRLGYLINTSRLQQLIENKMDEAALFVYSFNHVQNGKTYFYSASNIELMRHEALKNIFWGFGARKVSWRVFKIRLTTMTPDEAHSPLSIPDVVGTKVKRQNVPPAPRLMSKLKNLRYIAHITDITSESAQVAHSQIKLDRGDLKKLRLFGHPRNRAPADIKAFRYKFNEQRMENRYLLRTSIKIQARGQEISGVTEDISIHGLRIEIDGIYDGDLNMRVFVGLPKLQQITTKYDLSELHYRVIHVSGDKNVLHLRNVAGDDGLTARRFFEELIKQNRAQLQTYPDEEEIPGIGHALRCINAKNTPTLSFVLSKEGARYMPQAAVIANSDARLGNIANHFAERNNVNLEFLFRDRSLDTPFIQNAVKQVKTEHQAVQRELFMAYSPSAKDPRMVIIPRYEHRFSSDKSRIQFIKEAIERGQFIAANITVTITGKPDLEMLQAEINYISVYAIHRAKELEEKLWSIGACIHAVDITDEVMLRYGFDMTEIQNNHQIPAQHAVEPNGIKKLLQV